MSRPEPAGPVAGRPWRTRSLTQPAAGLVGLVVVVPVAVVLAAGGGAENTLRVVGPIATFGLPMVAMIAFWWDDWPGTDLAGGWSGLTDTLISAVAAFAFTLLGQAIVSRVDLRALLLAHPGPGHAASFPGTLPLAAGVFTAMLQLTLVSEGWPARRLSRKVPAGMAALVLCWGIGAVAYLLVVRPHGPVPGAVYGAWLTAVGVWQVLVYVALRGWPVALIRRPGYRRLIGNVGVIAAGWATYLLLRHGLGWEAERINAVAGCGVAAVLLVGMLWEPWPADRLRPAVGRVVTMVLVAVVTALEYFGLTTYADRLAWGRGATADDWITFAALNGLGLAVIIYVAIWRRWPITVVTGSAGVDAPADGGAPVTTPVPAIRG